MKNVVILVLGGIVLVQSAGMLAGREAKEDLKAQVEEIGDKAERCFLASDVDRNPGTPYLFCL